MISDTVGGRAKGRRASLHVPGSRRQWAAAAVVLIVVLAAAFGGGLYWRWRHSAHDLYEYGGGITFSSPAPASDAVYVNAAIAPINPRTANAAVKAEQVAPHITTNTAHATVEQIFTCKITPRSLMPTVDQDTSNCLSLNPFTPANLALGNPGLQIIYKLVAAEVGTVRIEGTDISYSDANQLGHLRVGIGVVVRFTSAIRSR